MMTFVADLEPKSLWAHFDQILMIPRGSKNEDKIRRHVVAIAERSGLDCRVDTVGNVVVKKLASAGCESAATTVLQSHLDMVNEKNSDVKHDFTKDPLKPVRDGEYLTADGTTLGSDNGIGVAAMLAIMEARDMTHGPLEFLFTIDEETGLVGASELDASMLDGKQLLNLDTEEEGAIYVGCAGGGDSALTLPLKFSPPPPDSKTLSIRLHGMKGGHSGVDIHLQRGNAIQLLARALSATALEVPFSLSTIEGGSAHNAIPREAFATIVVGDSEATPFTERLQTEVRQIQDEFRTAEPGMTLEVSGTEPSAEVMSEDAGATVLRLIDALPHGVVSMSYDIPDLVETSNNLATVKQVENALVIGTSSRSSVATALAGIRQKIRAIGELAGASVEEGNAYPGWKPDLDSHVLQVVKRVHMSELGSEPEIKAIHAGLECGIIGEKASGMDMTSIGPQIEFPHSPDERVKINSVGDFFRLLTSTLEELAKA
jgi:dipeptidase D